MSKRVVIYASDVQQLTGKSLRSCQRMIQLLKVAKGKQPHQPPTIKEFCDYYDIALEQNSHLLNI